MAIYKKHTPCNFSYIVITVKSRVCWNLKPADIVCSCVHALITLCASWNQSEIGMSHHNAPTTWVPGFQDFRMSWLFPCQLSSLDLHNFGSLEECPFLRIVYTRNGASWCCASQFQCVFYLSPCPAREFSCARSVHWRKFCHPPSQQIFWPTTVGADVPWLGFASPAWRSAKWANRQPDKKLENGVHETLPLADSLDWQLKLWLNLIHCSVILGHAQVESSRLVSWWSRERLISAAKWWYWRFRFFHTIWRFELAYASLWRAENLNPGCFAIALSNFLKLSLRSFIWSCNSLQFQAREEAPFEMEV